MRKSKKPIPRARLAGNEKICIHGPLHLGDSVMSIPFVRNLKTRFPKTKITLITKKGLAALWRGQPYADRIRLCASTPEALSKLSPWLKKQRFALSFLLATGEDVAEAHFGAAVPIRIGYDFWDSGRLLTHFISTTGFPTDPKLTRKQMVRNYLDLLETISVKPRFFRPRILKVKKNAARPKQTAIGIAPGASFGPSKRWPAEFYHELALRLSKTLKNKIILLGSRQDRLISKPMFDRFNSERILNQMGRTDLGELIEWILKCRLIVANDSGISHLSNALGVPTVTLFGSSSPAWTRPLDPRSEVITRSLPCSPCFQPVCPLGHTRCLKKISVDKVLSVIMRKFKGLKPS